MIHSIGCDIIEIDRFLNLSDRFLNKVYTEEEIRLFKDKPRSLAGNFACKEAVAKAMGTGFRGFTPRDIEILRDEKGKPCCNLYGKAGDILNKPYKIHVTISHDRTTACGFAVLEVE